MHMSAGKPRIKIRCYNLISLISCLNLDNYISYLIKDDTRSIIIPIFINVERNNYLIMCNKDETRL